MFLGRLETTILTTMGNWITPEQSTLGKSKKSQVTRTSALTIIFTNLVLVKGTGKLAPTMLRVSPWTVEVDGLVKRKRVFGLEDLLSLTPWKKEYTECDVWGWSMVIPWVGYSLSKLINMFSLWVPQNHFFYNACRCGNDASNGISRLLPWPYIEGLRMDEAMNPLTLLTFGFYGKKLLEQNGAPVRLVIWKYGLKGAKSIVRISFWKSNPKQLGSKLAQRIETFIRTLIHRFPTPMVSRNWIGMAGYSPVKSTLLFNGYENLVGNLYTGMNLKKFF